MPPKLRVAPRATHPIAISCLVTNPGGIDRLWLLDLSSIQRYRSGNERLPREDRNGSMAGDDEEPTVRIFLSWAHANNALKNRFIDLLMPRLKIVKGLRFEWWEDSHLWPGDGWREQIAARASEADYALQLISPEFFASETIINLELPPFVGPTAKGGCLPIGLSRVSFNGDQDLHGLEPMQVHLHDGSRFFNELNGPNPARFANAAATKIRQRVLKQNQWRPV